MKLFSGLTQLCIGNVRLSAHDRLLSITWNNLSIVEVGFFTLLRSLFLVSAVVVDVAFTEVFVEQVILLLKRNQIIVLIAILVPVVVLVQLILLLYTIKVLIGVHWYSIVARIFRSTRSSLPSSAADTATLSVSTAIATPLPI